jgi:hypothetical protein
MTKNKLPEGAIGVVSDFTPTELVGKHVCGVSGLVFDTEEAYLNHVSPVSGFKPTEIEHLEETTTPNARAISDAALDRGDAKK